MSEGLDVATAAGAGADMARQAGERRRRAGRAKCIHVPYRSVSVGYGFPGPLCASVNAMSDALFVTGELSRVSSYNTIGEPVRGSAAGAEAVRLRSSSLISALFVYVAILACSMSARRLLSGDTSKGRSSFRWAAGLPSGGCWGGGQCSFCAVTQIGSPPKRGNGGTWGERSYTLPRLYEVCCCCV